MKPLQRTFLGIITAAIVLTITACSSSYYMAEDTVMRVPASVQTGLPSPAMSNFPDNTTTAPTNNPAPQTQAPSYPSSPVEIPEGVECIDVLSRLFSPSNDGLTQATILDFEIYSDLVMYYFRDCTADIAYIVTTEHAIYHFSEREMTCDTILEYVNAFDSGIRFLKGWFEIFGINLEDPLEIFYVQADKQEYIRDGYLGIGGSTWMGRTFAEYDYTISLTPHEATYVITHEAVHGICRKLSVDSDFPSSHMGFRAFEEGMANMLQMLYGHSIGMLHDAYTFQYTVTFGSNDGVLDHVSDVSIALHHIALRTIEEEDFSDSIRYGAVYPVLMYGYSTAASFQCYLLERGSIEDFWSVYKNHQTAVSVYGKDMNGLIEEWLLYLEQLQFA